MAGDSQVPRVPCGDALEAVRVPQLAKLLPRESSVEDLAAWVTDAEIGQPVDVLVRKWMEKHAVNNAKDRNRGSDAQRERERESQPERILDS